MFLKVLVLIVCVTTTVLCETLEELPGEEEGHKIVGKKDVSEIRKREKLY